MPSVIFALLLEIYCSPPVWVHFVTSLPFLLITCLLPLRPLKGWLVCSQYFYKAGEGQLGQSWTPYAGGKAVEPPSARPW